MSGDLAPLMNVLQDISRRLQDVESALATGGGASSGSSAASSATASSSSSSADTADSAAVTAYKGWQTDSLGPFLAACKKLGGVAAELGVVATAGFDGLGDFIKMASQSKKPAQSDLANIPSFKAMCAAIKEAGGKKPFKNEPFFNEASAFAEGFAPALSWVSLPASMSPWKEGVQMALDGSSFYSNKILREKKADNVAWAKAFKSMLEALQAYVKEHHTAGVAFNGRGGDALSWAPAGGKASASSSGSSAPPPPGGPLPTPPSASALAAAGGKKQAGGLADVFASIKKIDQSSGKTAGLKHVDKSEMSHKNPELRKQGLKPKTKRAPAKKWGSGGAGPRKMGPPVKERRQFKWAIENQTGMCTITADECTPKNVVYIYGCVGATIVIEGKVNSVTVDNCQKTQVVFGDVISACEVVNCRQMKVQTKGICPSMAVDKTDGIVLYVSRQSIDLCTIVTSKSSEMNVSWPGATDDDAWNEKPIPEQFQHKLVDGTVTSDVSDLYAH
jgi:adenylyl cyclase-associated protein